MEDSSIERYEKALLAVEENVRSKIAKELSNLELPPEWRPSEVIRYIARKIEEGI